MKKLSLILAAVLLLAMCILPSFATDNQTGATDNQTGGTLSSSEESSTSSDTAAANSSVGYSSSRVTIPSTVAEAHNIMNYLYYYDSNYFFVNDADGLMELSRIVAEEFETFEGKTIYITKDIDMTGKTWTPIGTNFGNNVFQGTLDGLGHVIDNLVYTSDANDNMDGTTRGMGLIGYAKSCTVKNLVIGANSSFTYTGTHGDARLGAFIGTSLNWYDSRVLTIDNCMNLANVSGTNFAGGFVGQWYDQIAGATIVVSNCTNAGNISSAGRTGGFIGDCAGDVDFDNCRNTGAVTMTAETAKKDSTWQAAGGILGRARGTKGDMTIDDCINNGAITGGGIAGGIIGQYGVANVAVTGCKNYGLVTCANTNAGEFSLGQITGVNTVSGGASDIENCESLAGQTDATLAGAELTKTIDLTVDQSPDEPVITTAASTTAATTTATTKATTTAKTTVADETTSAGGDEAETTAEEAKKGCKGSVAMGALVVSAVIGTAAVVTKKRR
ncbi:MAG: hypothetical protein IJ038_06400 [Clostridia bacterium]|nr:hypothetical protein [Clostridia bacterium]